MTLARQRLGERLQGRLDPENHSSMKLFLYDIPNEMVLSAAE